MAERGSVQYQSKGETTEWEDILIKKGIVEKDDVLRGKGIDPDEQRLEEAIGKAREAEVERLNARTIEDDMAEASLEELDELEDELADDGMLEKYRAQRVAEMKAKAAAAKFGELFEISKADWVREVTDASKSVCVVAHLYEDGIVECRVMEAALRSIASKFREVKFVKIRSQQAVENWPEANLPTLFIYRDGALAKQLIRIDALGGKQMKADDLEWYLASQGIVETEMDENPARAKGRGANSIKMRRGVKSAGRRGSDDDDDDDDGDY
ncbi:unnamed protein product [Ectocarpus sp. 13 AM-2016]